MDKGWRGQLNRFQGVIMIHLDEERVQGHAFVKMVMVITFRIPLKVENFFNSWMTAGIPRRSQAH
jgi:hypothetical protein